MAFFLRALILLAFATGVSAGSVTATNGRLSLTAWDYTGWAICSLQLDSVEYIDAKDHGRCLQSAVSFDGLGEAFNPTEAGSYYDGYLPAPSSTLLYSVQGANDKMATEVQAAFWQGGRSNHVMRKWIFTGFGQRNITEHRIAFEIPPTEHHTQGQFEILTGYMPNRFSTFRTYDPSTGVLNSLSDGPGEQSLPVIFCSDDSHCMGVYSPMQLVSGGYGRWRFNDCVKWNMVARFPNPQGVFRFRVFTLVGTLSEITSGISWLVGK